MLIGGVKRVLQYTVAPGGRVTINHYIEEMLCANKKKIYDL